MNRRDILVGAVALAGCASVSQPMQTGRPVIIAHRGASAYRPEHTLAGYLLAIEQGADFIEPDLVMTKDHVLVCRHENEISGTTNVADHPEFADRRKAKAVDGTEALGWWVEDFTLAELKTLRARERIPQLRPDNTAYNDQFEIPTFAEALALAQQHGKGIYPELKHPTFLREQDLDPVPAFISAVREGGGQSAADMMYVQCFEQAPLWRLASLSSLRFRMIQLMSADGGPWDLREDDVKYSDMLSPAWLGNGHEGVSSYAFGIGLEKSLIIPRDSANEMQTPTDVVSRAHDMGLAVHAWTFRPENFFLPASLRVGATSAQETLRLHGNLDAELRAFYAAGVDGVFSDDPATAVAARN